MKKDREIEGKDQIKIDDYTPENGGTGHKGSGVKYNPKDNQKLIIAFVFLAVLSLMGILQAHYGAILVVTVIESVLIYLLNKDKYLK